MRFFNGTLSLFFKLAAILWFRFSPHELNITRKMNSVEYKYLIVTLEHSTFISMRFFDKVFFNGCGTTAAAMLNFILVPSLPNFSTPAHSSPQALRSAALLNLVPRALVTLVQRNGKTKTSGKMRLGGAFHWPLTERAQFHRKLINNNFVPRFSILSRARWTCTLWVRSLRARTWRTKQSLLRHINQQHVRRCFNFSFVSNRNDMFGAYLRTRTLRVLYCEGNRF